MAMAPSMVLDNLDLGQLEFWASHAEPNFKVAFQSSLVQPLLAIDKETIRCSMANKALVWDKQCLMLSYAVIEDRYIKSRVATIAETS